jgi:hypothetical protein
MTCPGFEKLIDYLDGRLTGVDLETIAGHLASGCEQCSADRVWYEKVRTVSASDESIEPPPWVLSRAVKLFEQRSRRSGVVRRLGEIVATLVFDSFAEPAIAGARVSASSDHQLLYRADDYNIDLMIAASGDQADIKGQILREGEFLFESVAGLELQLVSEGKTIKSTFTNKAGEFNVSAIDRGEYDLRFNANELSITIVGLAVV